MAATARAEKNPVHELFGSWCANDPERARSSLAASVVLHYPGASQLAGDYRGPDAVLGWIQQHGQSTDRVTVIPGKFFAHGDDVVALFTTDMPVAGGSRVLERSIAVFQLESGKIAEIWVTPMDLASSDAVRAAAGGALGG